MIMAHAGAKGTLPRAGQYNAAHRIIVVQLDQGGGDRPRQGQGQGVQVIGPVKAQNGDIARPLYSYNIRHCSD